MPDLLRPIIFARTPIEDLENCARKRYWSHEYQGRGLERIGLNLDLSVGGCTHNILADVLRAVKAQTVLPNIYESYIEKRLAEWEAEIRRRGLALELSSGYEQQEDGSIIVQEPSLDFTVGLYRCWMASSVTAWAAIRLPELINEYEILDIEQEEELPLSDNLLFLSRPDALLRRHSDGELFILNFKTVGEPNGWWIEQWRYDMQTLTEMLPVEARLGQRVSGVLIEGLVKGRKNCQYPKDSGQWWMSSPLCWAWMKSAAAPFPAEYACRYEWTDNTGNHRLGKGWMRTPIWEAEIGREGWLQWLFQNDHELIRSQFVSLPPILRSDPECDSWIRQNVERELATAASAVLMQESDGDLDALFPQHTSGGNCIRPNRCPFHDICWGQAALDPLANGYQWRIPNHPKELEVLNG